MILIEVINKPGIDQLGRECFVLGRHSGDIITYTINIHGNCIFQDKLEHFTSIEGYEMQESPTGEYVLWSDVEKLVEALKFYKSRCPNHEGIAPQYVEISEGVPTENFGSYANKVLKGSGVE